MPDEPETTVLALPSRYVVAKGRHVLPALNSSGALTIGAVVAYVPVMFGIGALLLDALPPALFVGCTLALFLPIGGWVRGRTRESRLSRRLAHASHRAAIGQLETAAAELDHLCELVQGHPKLHRSTVGMGAYVATLSGDLQLAQELFEEVGRRTWLARLIEGPHPGKAWMLRGRATCKALLGDIDEAAVALEHARGALHGKDDAQLLIAETVLALRRGEPRGLIDRLNGSWRRAELSLHAADLRALRILRGFALEREREGNYRAGITEIDIQAELHAARPFAEGEYDYLGAAWPQMQDFLRRHKLVVANG